MKKPTPDGAINQVLTEFSQPTLGGTIDRFFNEIENPTKGGFFDQFIACFKDFNDIFAEWARSIKSKFSNDFTNKKPEQYELPSPEN